MDDTITPTPKPPPLPPPQLPPAPPLPQSPQQLPLAVIPPRPTTFTHVDDNEPLFLPPTTPTTTATPSTSSFRKKRRSKLLRINTTPAPAKQRLTTEPTPCTECGKTFWSWKALFGHMRCHPERQWRGIVPPPHLRRDFLPPQTPTPTPTPPPTPTSDDHDVAASLLLLASGPPASTTVGPAPRFECSSCKKTFGSHQALGGHRASHKNVKGCFAITNTNTTTPIHVEDEGHNNNCMAIMQSQEDGLGLGLSLGLGLGSGHTCGVCFKVFPTGQALGGHMRCHWEKSEASSMSSVGPNEAQCGANLDLNLPVKLQLEGGASSSTTTTTCANSNSNSNMELDLRLGLQL